MDLEVMYTNQQWRKLILFNQTFSSNIGIQENQFKIINQWYLTPKKLSKTYPQTEAKCWRCHGMEADLHIWWVCPKTEPFWRSVRMCFKR